MRFLIYEELNLNIMTFNQLSKKKKKIKTINKK